jgi:hypothetical protein
MEVSVVSLDNTSILDVEVYFGTINIHVKPAARQAQKRPDAKIIQIFLFSA